MCGPPGTGKTRKMIRRSKSEFTDGDKERFKFITFHQSYSYEDFIEGIKPKLDSSSKNEIQYSVVPGVFCELANIARKDQHNNYALFIDEINRGNVASIFGELITLIEEDKREKVSVTLPYSKEKFTVPKNLYIIGTMNTADKSVEALDTALRRRFSFEEIKPDPSLISSCMPIEKLDLEKMLETINKRINVLLDEHHLIGHSYFMKKNIVSNHLKIIELVELRKIFSDELIPLLDEYFYRDRSKIKMILGPAFVKKERIAENTFINTKNDDNNETYNDEYTYEITIPKTLKGFKSIYDENK